MFKLKEFQDIQSVLYYSSNAQTHFRKAFNLSSCALFGELNFSGITGSLWSHIADECITESTNIRNLLRQVSENRPQLTHSHCQSYLFTNTVNVCQCSMDCLLTFLLSENSTIQSGYIHLRKISCNQSLFIAAITDLFNKTHNATSFTTRSKKCLEGATITRLWLYVFNVFLVGVLFILLLLSTSCSHSTYFLYTLVLSWCISHCLLTTKLSFKLNSCFQVVSSNLAHLFFTQSPISIHYYQYL